MLAGIIWRGNTRAPARLLQSPRALKILPEMPKNRESGSGRGCHRACSPGGKLNYASCEVMQ